MTDDELLRLRARAVTPEEMDRFLEHIAGCDQCAQRMAQMFEQGPLLEVTPLFCESVRREIEETSEERLLTVLPEGGALSSKERRPAAKQEHTPRAFRSYPFKVVLAACVTLVLMSAGMFGTYVEGPPQREGFLNQSIKPWERFSREFKDAPQWWTDIMEGERTL